jgi:hypothetical protein
MFGEYIASLPAREFFWWSAVPALLALAGFAGTFAFLKRTRLIEDMPTSRLRSAAQGYIEVEGIARLMEGPEIVSPLSATRCVWWRYKVEEKQTDSDRGTRRSHWATIESALSDDSFLLDDGTGTCVVDPAGARVIPTVSRRWYGATPRPHVGPEVGKGFWRALYCRYRYTEELILVANEIYAIGGYRTQMGGPDSFDEQVDVRELLAKWKTDKRMMGVLDRNQDGTIDMKEWEAARRMAMHKVRQEHVQRAVETTDLHLMAKPRDERPYILSGIPQAQLVRRYRLYAAGCLGLVAASGGFVLWAMQARGLIA